MMNISENMVIRNDMIFLNKNINTRNEVLHFLTQKAEEAGIVADRTEFLNKVLERESTISTAIGYQIAMPHGKSLVVEEPFVGFLRTTSQFIWSNDDNEFVDMIFLIGVPAENEDNIHLKVISQLSKKLLNDSFREQLNKLNDIEEIYSLLQSINQNL